LVVAVTVVEISRAVVVAVVVAASAVSAVKSARGCTGTTGENGGDVRSSTALYGGAGDCVGCNMSKGWKFSSYGEDRGAGDCSG
jgi:hypothetical protein